MESKILGRITLKKGFLHPSLERVLKYSYLVSIILNFLKQFLRIYKSTLRLLCVDMGF